MKFANPQPDEESTPMKSGEEVNADQNMDPEPAVATPQETGDSKSGLDDRPELTRSDSLKDRSRSISEQLTKVIYFQSSAVRGNSEHAKSKTWKLYPGKNNQKAGKKL